MKRPSLLKVDRVRGLEHMLEGPMGIHKNSQGEELAFGLDVLDGDGLDDDDEVVCAMNVDQKDSKLCCG